MVSLGFCVVILVGYLFVLYDSDWIYLSVNIIFLVLLYRLVFKFRFFVNWKVVMIFLEVMILILLWILKLVR